MSILDIFKNKISPVKVGLLREDKIFVQRKWAEIEELVRLGGPSNFSRAVVEADKLLDFTLKKLNYPGEKMGDRIRSARGKFSDYGGVWKAHILRNQIVHEPEHELLSFSAKKAVSGFEKGLEDLRGL